MKIFLSYSRRDGQFTQQLARDLRQKGYSTWLDVGDIVAGELWRREIVDGIENCAAFVIILSSNSIRSENVVKELSLAESSNKKIFPVLLEEVDIPKEMKYQIAGVQLVSFINSDYNKSLESLVAGFVNSNIRASFSENGTGQGQTYFVGRGHELASLQKLIDKAAKQHTVLSFITGEAGSGKTTLLNEFKNIAQRKYDKLVAVKGKFNPETGLSDPYAAFVEILLKLTCEIDIQAVLSGDATLKASMDEAKNLAIVTLTTYAPDLVGTIIPSSSLQKLLREDNAQAQSWYNPLKNLLQTEKTEQKIDKAILFQQFSDFLAAFSTRYLLLMAFEDIQWADEASIELFIHLTRVLEHSPLLITGTYRPEDIRMTDGNQQSGFDKLINTIKQNRKAVWIDLDNISNEERLNFTTALVDAFPNQLPVRFKEKLFNHTLGNPLFITELLLDLQERGCLFVNERGLLTEGMELDWSILPRALEDVIEQRIGQLSEDLRNILTVASVEGNNFTVQVIAHIQEINERELVIKLSRELDKHHRLVKETGAQRINKKVLSNFSFSNLMYQQFLYDELTQGEKFNLHSQVAGILEALYADNTERIAAQLARHYDLAGETEKAISYLSMVGKRALRLSAYDAAQTHLSRAIELIADLPAGIERDKLELDLQLPLSAAIKVTRGWASAEVIEVYNKARLLCRRTDNHVQLAPVLYGLWAVQLVLLQLDNALGIAEECMELGKQSGDDDLTLQGYLAMGNTFFWTGKPESCYQMMQLALELYKPENLELHLVRYGQDPRIMGLTFCLLSSGILGKIKEASRLETEIIELSDKLEHPFSRAIALQAVAWHQYHLNNINLVRTYAGELVNISKENGFLFYHALGLMFEGWAMAMGDNINEGLATFENGLEFWKKATGNELFLHSLYSIIKTEIYIKAGRADECNKFINKALEISKKHQEKCYESILYFFAGYLIENQSPGLDMAAKSCYENALAIAAKQRALLFELRAGLSVSKIMLRNDEATKADELIRNISSRFSGEAPIQNFEAPGSTIFSQ